MADMELYQRWAELIRFQPNLSTCQASELLHVGQSKLEDCIREAEKLETRTPPWLLAQCLMLRADQLDVDGNVEQAELMDARAREVDPAEYARARAVEGAVA